jgi:hypothetical protein
MRGVVEGDARLDCDRGAPQRVPWLLHPKAVFAPSILSFAFGVGFAVALSILGERFRTMLVGAPVPKADQAMLDRVFGHPWLSLLLGAAVGMPAVALQKRLLRANAELYANLSVLRIVQGFRWSLLKASLRASVAVPPLVVVPCLLAGGLAWLLRITWIPAFMGTGIPHFLTYPEQREIYRAVLSKLAQATGNQEGDGVLSAGAGAPAQPPPAASAEDL